MKEELSETIGMGLPKGHMSEEVFELLRDAGIRVRKTARNYRPAISLDGFEAKLLKPQNIVEMLDAGSRDIGFSGADLVAEHDVELDELLDTGLDRVRVVAAAPSEMLVDGELPDEALVVASEFENLTRKWIRETGIDAEFVHSHGATEVFPPEDADLIVDITQTGSTLQANNLEVVDVLMKSSTRLYASPNLKEQPDKYEAVERLVLVLKSVLNARRRVMVELNVDEDQLGDVVDVLPSMREPTISSLHGNSGYAVKSAVPRKDLPEIIPMIKEHGGTDIVVTSISQIIT